MTDFPDNDRLLLVIDIINNTVISNPNAPRLAALHLETSGRMRHLSKLTKLGDYRIYDRIWEFEDLLPDSRRSDRASVFKYVNVPQNYHKYIEPYLILPNAERLINFAGMEIEKRIQI